MSGPLNHTLYMAGAKLLGLPPKTRKEEYSIMPLTQIIVVLIVVGVILWLINRFIPMAGSIKSILNAVVIIAVVLWLLNVFGVLGSLSKIRVGK
jgi:hypothetical protein